MDIQYLDELPIEDTYIYNQDNTSNALLFKGYLNLSFNCINTISRFSELQELQSREIDAQDEASLYSLLLSLESYMVTLLTIPTIGSMDRRKLSPHYCRRKIGVSSLKILPTDDYVNELMFSNFKTWVGTYGTLSYYQVFKETLEEYQSTSQLIDVNIRSLIDLTVQPLREREDTQQIVNIYDQFIEHTTKDSIESDTAIYRFHSDLVSRVNIIRTSYKRLQFLQSWLPKVISWYLQPYSETDLPILPLVPETENSRYAYDTLKDIACLCLSNGIDHDSLVNLGWDFIHQSICPILYKVEEELVDIRKRTSYIAGAPSGSIDILLEELVLNISLNDRAGLLREASQLLLETYPNPSGLNMALLISAASLLNRAYILVHTHISNNRSTDQTLVPTDELGRIFRLIYLASRLLKKSNLEHMINTADNLALLSGIEDGRKDFKDDPINDNY
jgi:hypothetical protein